MANIGSVVRKNLRDLSDSMELRELNRQLDWMWKKILGGLTDKDFTEGGLRNVVKVVERTVADEITADSVTTNVLKTALAEMMVAQIGVANISYAQIVDVFSERLFTEDGLAGEFRMDKLKVYQGQIVDLIVNSFRLVTGDGSVYKVSVDEFGELVTEYVGNQDEWMTEGEVPEGYSAVASDMTVGEVTAGTLYVAGSADVMKLTAKMLIADSAWVNELTSQSAFIQSLTSQQAFIQWLQTEKIVGGKSLTMIGGEVTEAKEAAEFATIYDSTEPPSVAPSVGKIWIDRGVTPAVFRRWIGSAASTSRSGGGWETINSTDEILAIQSQLQLQQANTQAAINELRTVVINDNEGVHIRKLDNENQQLTTNELLLTQRDINMVVNGKRNSTYGDGYIKLLGMVIRVAGSGIVIEAAE